MASLWSWNSSVNPLRSPENLPELLRHWLSSGKEKRVVDSGNCLRFTLFLKGVKEALAVFLVRKGIEVEEG